VNIGAEQSSRIPLNIAHFRLSPPNDNDPRYIAPAVFAGNIAEMSDLDILRRPDLH
jgi:hypothetical protein